MTSVSSSSSSTRIPVATVYALIISSLLLSAAAGAAVGTVGAARQARFAWPAAARPFTCSLSPGRPRPVVARSKLCNGVPDCPFAEDEDPARCGACPPQYMGCDGAPGSMRFKCVHEDQVCDGVPTCQDMSDEMDCFHFTDPLVPPASGQRLWKGVGYWRISAFAPTNMDYVRRTWLETDVLPRLATTARRSLTYVLPRQAVQVTSSGVMVSMAGAPVRLECPFTYTKFLCGAAAPASGAATGFQNLSVACIDTLLECDGVPNCLNAEDERSCLPPPSSQLAQRTAAEQRCRSSNGFVCDNKCIPNKWRCDGQEDCRDLSDESNCPMQPIA